VLARTDQLCYIVNKYHTASKAKRLA